MKIVVFLATLALITPASASVKHDLLVARARWPQACHPVAIKSLPQLSASQAMLGSGELGWAWEGPDVPSCTIWLDASWRDWDAPMLCTVIVHEVGHLAGAHHSHNRRSVMYPEFGYVPGYCR